MTGVASPEFSRLFKNLLNNVQYCKMCLQTDSETSLVRPTHVKILLHHINCIKIDLSDAMVCIFCEAKAAAAVDVVTTLKLAQAVATLLSTVSQNTKYLTQFKKYLNNHLTKPRLSVYISGLVTSCETQMSVPRLNFCRTKTLCIDIDTEPEDEGQCENKRKKEITKPKNFGEIVISDESDDECVYVPNIQPKPIKQLLKKGPTQTPELLLPKVPDPHLINIQSVTLEPITATDDRSKVPNIETNWAKGLVYFVNERGDIQLQSIYNEKGDKYILPTPTPISDLPNPISNLPNPISNLPNSTNNFQNPKNTKQYPRNNLQNTTSNLSNLTNNLPNPRSNVPNTIRKKPASQATIQIIMTGKDILPVINYAQLPQNGLPVITNAESLQEPSHHMLLSEKELQDILKKRLMEKKMVETDWEEKIPMDLISLMDSSESKSAIASVHGDASADYDPAYGKRQKCQFDVCQDSVITEPPE